MKKKIGNGFFLLTLFLFAALVMNDKTALAKTNSKYAYEVKDNKVTITEYIGEEKYVNVPSTIDGKPVTIIDEYAFYDTNIKTVRIPKSVVQICHTAFGGCKYLTGVIIGDGVKRIPYNAFTGCDNLKYVILGKSVELVDDSFPSYTAYSKLQYIAVNGNVCEFEGYNCLDSSVDILEHPDAEIDLGFCDSELVSEGNVKVKFVNGEETLFTLPLIKTGTKLHDLYGLSDTSDQVFHGWYTTPTFEEKAEKVGDVNITVYARFEDRPKAPSVKVSRKSDTEYKLSWDKKEGYYYQVEVKYANYRYSKYIILQEYKQDIGSYTAKVNGNYDVYFRVKCYTMREGVKAYSNYSDAAYAEKPTYPTLFISDFMLDMNSVGGVSISMNFFNNSSKTIKYVTFTVNPYNAVDDRIACVIWDDYSFQIEVTGPVKTDQFNYAAWDVIWYNGTTEYAKIVKAEIIYTDGTTKTISMNKKSTWD
ncbi:MAG: Fibronectin type domain protein [Herbinix sp.]|jgi:hypothetical protein|nr:Fibronectin type domain protein [Herbinix sp.]